MGMKRLSILTVTVWIVLLSACASPREALLEEGATPYTLDELVALVSGKTEPWSNGAGYNAIDGREGPPPVRLSLAPR